jgi:hypothetical protein
MDTKDIDSIINLFNYYRDDANIDPDLYDEDRVLTTVKEYNIRNNLFFRVAYTGLRPVGLIGGFLSPDPVERELSATIQFNYLIPEFANSENYSALIQEFERWAKACNAVQIRAIDIGKNINRLDDIYDDLGFNPIRIAIMNKELA